MITKRGYTCAKSWRPRTFGTISIEGEFHYHPSKKLVYSEEKENDKLYLGQPCIYTDNRFNKNEGSNYFHRTYLYFSSRKQIEPHVNLKRNINRNPKKKVRKPISLKACIRKVNKCVGIPKGTVIDFGNHWCYRNTKSSPNYVYIHNGKNAEKTPKYEVNYKGFSRMFTDNDWCNELTTELRKAGFLVNVFNSNPARLIGEEEGEIAYAYGYNKMIGFSTNNDTFHGYSDGRKFVLYDYRGYFDKWSKALCINKTTPISDIVKQLITETIEDVYPN